MARRARYPRVFGSPAAKAQSRAAFVASGGAGPRSISLPAGFGWDSTTLPYVMSLNAGVQGGTAAAPQTLVAAARNAPLAQTFHVDPVNGNDANTGISTSIGTFMAGTALKTVSAAVTKANTSGLASRILIKADTNPWFTRANGAGTTFPTVELAVEGVGGIAVFTGSDAHNSGAAWALDATYTTCYSVTESNASGAIDLLNTRWLGEAQGARLLDRWTGVGRQANVEMVKYASPTALNAATITGPGGGYVNSGGKTYVKRGDGVAVSDANTRIFRGTTTVAPAFSTGTAASSKSLYLKNLDFHGGFLSTNAGTRNVFGENCRAMFTNLDIGVAGNGFATDFVGSALWMNCESYCNGSDAFNPHGVNGQHQLMTVNCLGWDNGRSTSQSNNGLTGHEGTLGLDINGDYQLNRGGTLRIIDNAKAFFWGTKGLGDLGDQAQGGTINPTAVMANNNAIIYVPYCTVGSSQRALYTAENGQIRTNNTTITQGSVSGNVSEFTL